MIFEIVGSLLERLVDISTKFKISVGDAAARAFEQGTQSLLEANVPANEVTESSNSLRSVDEYIRENYKRMTDVEIARVLGYAPNVIGIKRRMLGFVKGKKSRKVSNDFIRQNAATMTDSEMAAHMGTKTVTVAHHRRLLGLKRKTGATESGFSELAEGNHDRSSSLTAEQKSIVMANLAVKPLREIASDLQVSTSEIFRARNELLIEFVAANWKSMSDGDIARRFGFKHFRAVLKVRNELGLSRMDLRKVIPSDFDMDAFRKAVLEGGKVMTEYLRERQIKVTRQRISQVAELSGIRIADRKPSWYAIKFGRPEYADKALVLKLLEDHKSVHAISSAIGLTENHVSKLIKVHGIARPLTRVVMVSVSCSHCEKTLRRPKTFVDSHPNQKLWFCNKKCQGTYMGLQNRKSNEPVVMIKHVCANPACKKEFERDQLKSALGQVNFYCTDTCRYACLPRGRNKPQRKKLICDNCETEYPVTPYRFKYSQQHVHHFCKSSCHQEWRRKNHRNV